MRFRVSSLAVTSACFASGLVTIGAHGVAVFFALLALLETISDAAAAIVDAIREQREEVRRLVCAKKEGN